MHINASAINAAKFNINWQTSIFKEVKPNVLS